MTSKPGRFQISQHRGQASARVRYREQWPAEGVNAACPLCSKALEPDKPSQKSPGESPPGQ
ncbi:MULTISPECIES: hypothetical protein [Shewanella]|uniref:hypothetical protein n=1 Tax=Shewanella TaxID=22 RepID=UPI00048EEF15|nr:MULTISPECIES: hypothetical protein [Shewanella]EKT4487720.1 hypothetical protein [Shewanella algae]MBC8797987.1 hypothetical protein [Shewanella algae]MBO2579897.1 hypothetical protein [Shewanella algae]MBO2588521.1 hypothetical protein [Shewanella algae]MBO2601123.1 hypothetical protein [Shewanella algae]